MAKTTEARGDVTAEFVVGQVKNPQGGQVSDGRREHAGEPIGWQAQRHHSTVPAPAPHPLPSAASTISAPVPGSERVAAAALKASSATSSSASAAGSVEKNMEAAVSSSSEHDERIAMLFSLVVGFRDLMGCKWCTKYRQGACVIYRRGGFHVPQ